MVSFLYIFGGEFMFIQPLCLQNYCTGLLLENIY